MHFSLRIILLLLLFPTLGFAQSPIETYVKVALENNIALTQKNLSYDKSLAALDEAKATFFPTLALKARYSMARGGRNFEIATGDLVNPIFSNLNLINSIGKATDPTYPDIPEYPSIPNEEVNFLRRTEHETKLQLAFPIFNTAILNNHRIKGNMVQMEKISVAIYKKELIKEVKIGYFNYLKAREGVQLFQNTMDLVNENLRTANSLYRNQKVTIDEVYAAEAQVKEVEQQLAEMQKNQKVAQAYFNFLLNQDYNTAIEVTQPEDLPKSALTVDPAREMAFSNRAEFQQLNYALAATDNKIKLDKGNRLPNLTLVGDYGFQGTEYSFTSEDDFMMGSLVLSWDIFNKQTKHKIQQSKIDREIIEQRKAETQQQIGLQVVSAYYELETTLKSIELAEAQKEAAQKAFRLVNKKYQQGQANLVQFMDSRTRLTNSEQQLIITKYDYQIKLAEFERAVGQ
jgi:outer membrane protein TolC